MKLDYKIMLTTATLVLAATATVSAWSQSLSGRGIEQQAMGQANCVSEIERLQQIIQTLKQQKQEHLDCNENGRVFDGDGCVDVQPLQAVWDDLDTPTTLRFEDIDGDQVGDTVEVDPRGQDGQPGECPSGYRDVEQ